MTSASRVLQLTVVGLLALGAALRLAMGFESFWLDEAWSHAMARQAQSALEIFTSFRHDNNHPLNTLYLYAIDDIVGRGHWITFRLPALVAGWLSLVVLVPIASRWGRLTCIATIALATTSFPLISASAQARGYAGAILCSLLYVALTPLALREENAQREAWRAGASTIVAAIGLLFHPTFVYVLVGAILGSAAEAWIEGRSARRILVRVVVRHAAPALVVGALLFGLYTDLQIGGGLEYDRFVSLRQAIAQTMALPRRGPGTWLATGIALVLMAQGLRVLVRNRDPRAAFFVGTIFLAPCAVIVVADPQLFYARYLLAIFPWFYLLVAIGLADAWRSGVIGRSLAVAVLAFFLGSNLWRTSTVLVEGRNDYVRTLDYIDRETDGPVIEIGSDHDFRNATVLRFYAERLASARPVVYRNAAQWPAAGPEWYLRHDWKAGHDPEERVSPRPGLRYRRVASFEHGPGDGFQWFVYRRESVGR